MGKLFWHYDQKPFFPNRVMSSPDGVKDDTHYFNTDEIKTNLFSSG